MVAGTGLPPFFFYTLAILVGMILGSFNSVLVSRIPLRQSLGGRSRCPHCDVQIRNIDNIPILGFIFLGGRCRSCRAKISVRYLVLEILTAGLVLVPLIKFDRVFECIAWIFFVVLAVALSAIDFEHHRLPDPLTGSLYLAGLVFLTLDSFTHHNLSRLNHAFIASIALGGFYWIVNFLSKGGMGMGDVKLATSIGLFCGYISMSTVYVASMISFALGSLVGVVLIVAKKASRKSALPFGPFMLMGAIASIYVTPWISHLRGLS